MVFALKTTAKKYNETPKQENEQMTMDTHSDDRTVAKPGEYQQALRLAEAGNCEQALACIQEYLATAPHDVEALNDTGTLLFSLGYIDEAVNHLTKAAQLNPDSTEIIWNLVEVYLADNKPQQAAEFFDRMEQMGILNPDVLNRTADVFLKNDALTEAAEMLGRSLEMAPQQEILIPMIDIIRGKIAEKTD